MTKQTANQAHQSFSNAFFEVFLTSLSQASGTAWKIAAVADAVADYNSPLADAEPLRLRLTFDGSLRGEFLLDFHRGEAAMLASKLLRQPATEFGAEQSQVLLKLIRTAANDFRDVLAPQYGSLTIVASAAAEPLSTPTRIAQMTAVDDAADRASILMYLDSALLEAISLHSATPNAAANTAPVNPVPASTAPASPVPATTAAPIKAVAPDPRRALVEEPNFEMVMDVELNVTLRFGQRQLTLREVLELTSGSVIELDRQVEEPVELLLDGKVIARGEAVVIDGHYGLQVTEVPHPLSYQALR